MTPEKLKASILQYAIQGKLVQQRPEEGTGEELYRQIQAEKQRLIKEGKIKKEKPLAEITEDEIPFDIPESWKWLRFGDVCELISGSDLQSEKYNTKGDGIPYITGASNISNDGILTINRWVTEPNNIALRDDLLITCKGTVGKMAVLKEDRVHIARQIMAVRVFHKMSRDYIQVCLSNYVSLLNRKAKSIIPGIDRKNVLNLMIPLPPLAEQHRIVAKIEKLLPLVDRYAASYEKLELFNAKFPEDMKKSILQYAIQGKLVEQRPEEGTGEELYRQIRAEKQRLIKEGKIKKEKPLAEITEGEIPFDIPESWKWCRIGSIFSLQAGKNIQASEIMECYFDDAFLCYGGNGIRGYVSYYNHDGDYPIIGRQGALCGNIKRATGKFYATEHAVCVETFCNVNVGWVCLFLEAINLNQYATATAQPGLAVEKINRVLIPLPPLGEQHRIVAKIEELLPLCGRLN